MSRIDGFALALFAILWPLPSHGHFPVFLTDNPSASNPYVLSRPYQKSIAIYTALQSIGDLDVFRFDLKDDDVKDKGSEILIGTLVPACEPLKDLLLSWALIGPQQKNLSSKLALSDQVDNLELNPGQGVLLVRNQTQGSLWRETYSAHYYFYQQRRKVTLTKPGQYKILVWSNNNLKGDYVLEFGDKEMWSLKDILYTLMVYPKLLLEAEISTPNCSTNDGPFN